MDKIADMLITIKNAGFAEKRNVVLPYSSFKHDIANCLVKNNYVASVSKKTDKGGKPVLDITLSFDGKNPKVSHVERVSKPSRRIYVKSKDIKPIKHGFGIVVISTPKGVLTGEDARKEMVGGEILFKVW